MKNAYGRFADNKKFTVTNPATPEPWLHYLIRPEQGGTETFCCGITATGGGFDAKGTHENTFVDTRVHLNDSDELSRTVYVKDAETGEAFSTSWQPVRHEKQKYEISFAPGYAESRSSCLELEIEEKFFVPMDFDGWIREISVRNASERNRTLELYPFVPMHMGDALVRLLAGDNDAFFGGAAFDPALQGIVFRRNHGIPAGSDPEHIQGMLGNVALFKSTLNDEHVEYETDMERFLGTRFHSLSAPRSILESRLCSRNTAMLRRPCGAFKNRIELEPGETIEFAVFLAVGKTDDYYLNGARELAAICGKAENPLKRKEMFAAVTDWWNKRLGLLELSCPEEKINRAFPWIQYQCEIVLKMNRMKSRFHTGYEYGWGFRDILQDILYLLPYRSADMKDLFIRIAAQIFPDGRTYHNFFIDQPGNLSVEASDDPLWFPQAIIAWCKETGDLSFLDQQAPWARDERRTPPGGKNGGKTDAGNAPESGTILEHCEACVARVLEDRSPRGLPYMKDCDWNDDLNEKRINGEPSHEMESVMVAQQLVGLLPDFAELLDRRAGKSAGNQAAAGKPSGERAGNQTAAKPDASDQPANLAARPANFYRAEAEKIRTTLLSCAMDEKGWFKRALAAVPGRADLGSSVNREGKIFLEPQVFAVNTGTVPSDQAASLLEKTAEELDTGWGAMLCYPYFSGLAERKELPEKSWNIEKEPPGIKENGGIFMHLNAWLVEAWCRAGKGKKAAELFVRTLPESMSADQDRYRCEPWVYPEYVRGKGLEEHGRGGHTWLTGTAPTMHRALAQFIFGLQAEYDGLKLDPCVDPSWKRFSISRAFRGARYEIEFLNPDGAERGIASISIDGTPFDGCVLPAFPDGKTHRVTAVMGKKKTEAGRA